MEKKLIACDVCDTLFKSNTTFDFIRFILIRESKLKYFLLEIISRKYSPLFFVFAVGEKILKKDLIRLLAIKFLKGKTQAALEQLAEDFYDHFLNTKRNEEIFNLINDEKKEGEIWLVSSSIDPVVKVIAKRNDFHFICSMLEYKSNLADGKLLVNLSGNKHHYLGELMKKNNYKKLIVITDNRSDYEMVQMADERFVVINAEADRHFWEKLQPTFIHLK